MEEAVNRRSSHQERESIPSEKLLSIPVAQQKPLQTLPQKPRKAKSPLTEDQKQHRKTKAEQKREAQRVSRAKDRAARREATLEGKKQRQQKRKETTVKLHKRLKLKNKLFSPVPQPKMGPRSLPVNTDSLKVIFTCIPPLVLPQI